MSTEEEIPAVAAPAPPSPNDATVPAPATANDKEEQQERKDDQPLTAPSARKLEQLQASATQQYSLKNYPAAAEFFSEAAELQDQLNGEMSPDNADLLYQYGRCLYHVAVSRSDVLGGKVAGSTEEPKRKKRKIAPSASSSAAAAAAANGGEGSSSSAAGVISDALQDGEQKMAEEVVEAVVEENTGKSKQQDESLASKPYFQITGDENWTDSEEEDDDDEADAEAEEEEDDFATAYEILDMARVLLARKLQAAQEAAAAATGVRTAATKETPEQRQIKERLADTHDLQAEISLENERFHDAIKDTRDGLLLKLELYPEESSLVAEAHFKLSLALEFASVTSTTTDDDNQPETTVAQVDETLRREAALEMEKAIASCTARIAMEEAALATLEGSKQAEQRRSIADVKDMVVDMQQRLVDLRNPAVSLSGISGPAGAPDGSDPLQGVLGAMLGESKAEQKKRIEDATKNANDLTGLIKHKKKPKVEGEGGNDITTDGASVDGKGKRKAMMDNEGVASGAKKVKFENGS